MRSDSDVSYIPPIYKIKNKLINTQPINIQTSFITTLAQLPWPCMN